MKPATRNSIRMFVLSIVAAVFAVTGSVNPVQAQTMEIPGYVRIHLNRVIEDAAQSGDIIRMENMNLDAIVGLLDSSNRQVVSAAAYSLGEIRDAEAVPALISALNSNHPHQRRIAAHALGKIGDRRAVNPLIELLRNESQPVAVQVSAIMSLGRIGDPEAEPILTSMRRSPQNWLHKSANVALLKIDVGQGFKVASVGRNAISK